MKIKSNVGWAMVGLFALFVFANGAPAGDAGIYFGERDWIDRGLDLIYGNKDFDIETSVLGKTFGLTTSGIYTDKQRILFVSGVVAVVFLLIGFCCYGLCCGPDSTRRNPPTAVFVGPRSSTYSTPMAQGVGASVPIYPTLPTRT